MDQFVGVWTAALTVMVPLWLALLAVRLIEEDD